MDEFDPTFLTDLVGHIYEAAVDPKRWDDFLGALESIYPDSRVTLFGHENGRPAVTLHKNFASDDLRAYTDYYVRNSPYVARGLVLPVGQPVVSEMVIDDRELKTTEHYNDFVRPRRLGHYATGAIIERRPDRVTALSLADHKNDVDRRARQLRLIEILVPHLVRAFRLHRVVTAQRTADDAAQAVFDRWGHAAFVLDGEARVVVMNRAADKLLHRADGLYLGRDGKLRSLDEARTRALDVALRRCAAMIGAVDADARSAQLDGIVLPRSSGGAPLRAMISPLPFLNCAATADFEGGSVLLMMFDPDHSPPTPIGWIARQFNLTPAEQRLTEAIVSGVPLAQAAEQLGIRINTARTRLKTIQAKTHCHRQVDLVRLALSLPAVRQD